MQAQYPLFYLQESLQDFENLRKKLLKRLHIDFFLEKNYNILGFSDGEVCFNVNFSPAKDHRQGIRVNVSFSIFQHQRSQEILHLFQQCFSSVAEFEEKQKIVLVFEIKHYFL